MKLDAWFADQYGNIASVLGLVITAVTLVNVRRIRKEVRAGSSLSELPLILDTVGRSMVDVLNGEELTMELRERIIRMGEDVRRATAAFDGELAEGCRNVVKSIERYGERKDRESLNDAWETVVVLHQRLEKEREMRIWQA